MGTRTVHGGRKLQLLFSVCPGMHMKTNPQRPQKLFIQPVRYEIPAFQRRYVWKQEEQWEPLWQDLEELAGKIMEEGQAEPHFMGAVVLQQMQFPTATIERRIVVDGQQRLITLQLLLDAIQSVLEKRTHENPAKRLAALVANGDAFLEEDRDHAFKVWPTTVDRKPFRHAMNNDLVATDYVHSRIVQAHNYFTSQTEQWLERFDQDLDTRSRAADALEAAASRHLELVIIDLDDSDDAHVIFETLNARGTPLLQSDMVKNKIFHYAGIGIDDDDIGTNKQANHIWPFDQDDWWVLEVGRGLQRRPRIDVFLNHWLTLRNRSEMKPYDEFRAFEKYTDSLKANETSILRMAKDLRELGKKYRKVEEMRLTDIEQFLKRRNVMNVGVVTPLLLWLLSEELPPVLLRNSLVAIESFLVRRVVCGYSARSYGELFVGLIQQLAETSTENIVRAVVDYLDKQTSRAALWPDNDELRERLVTAPLYKYLTRGRLRMVLEGIETKLRTNFAETEEVPENLSIEHIMPQSWHSDDWPLPDKLKEDEEALDNRRRTIHTIGNLTLVKDRLNSSLSNAPWIKKRDVLADHSVLYLNKQLVNKGPEVWDENVIIQRSNNLYQSIATIWPHATKFYSE